MFAFIKALYGKSLSLVRFLRTHLKASIATFVVLFLAWISYAVTRPKQAVYVTAEATRGELHQTVEAVGTVISEKDLSLQFPTIDTVSKVFVKEGDIVKAGQKLASLRSGSLAASVASASANVQSAVAQLNQLLEGARPEDIVIARAQVENKKASLDAVRQTLRNAEENLYIAEGQLVTLKNQASISLSGEVASASSIIAQHLATTKTALLSTQGVFNANDIQDAVVKGNPAGYDAMQRSIGDTIAGIAALQLSIRVTDYQSALSSYAQVRQLLSVSSDILNRAYDILSGLPLTSYLTNTSKETNKATIATQKSYVQTALSAIDTASKSLRDDSAGYDTKISAQQADIVSLQGTRDRAKADILTYETSLSIDQAQLDLTLAPARKTDIDAAQARVRQAQAELARAAAQFNDTILVAPVDGIVTKVNVKQGEMRPSSEPSVTMLGNSPYRIEMFVSEVDIPKVKLAQTGSIKLDAFHNEEFALKVSEIDSAATDKDGVSKYRVKLDFVTLQENLKVGMTGDGEITTGSRSDVVIVPLRAVLERTDSTKYVRVLQEGGKSFEERTVVTGMEGVGGNVEVTDVKESETVIVLIKE